MPMRGGYSWNLEVQLHEYNNPEGKQQKRATMFTCESYFLQQLAVLVVCHSLTVAENAPRYFLVQRPMSWDQSREFCLRHFVDLAVMNTERQYWYLYNDTDGESVSFWIGLQRSQDHNWTWVNGDGLDYEQWLNNKEGHCGSFEAMLNNPNKMCSRYCDEPHASVCEGPLMVGPQSVSWLSRSDSVSLSWKVSTFMQRTPHSYTVRTCSSDCSNSTHHYTRGTGFTVHISNLTSATNYSFEITASVTRPDNKTARNRILHSGPTTLHIQTENSVRNIVAKLIKLLFLAPSLWVLYLVFRKGELKEFNQDRPLMETPAENTVVDMFFLKTRGVG